MKTVSPSCPKTFQEQKDLPLISIILTHKDSKYLSQAIKSIEKQTYLNIEVVLIDMGSSPESIKQMQDLTWGWWETRGWKVLYEHKTINEARNFGVKHAIGSFVFFMDADDIAKPHQIETLIKVALNKRAELVTSGHDVFSFDTPNGISLSRYVPIGPAKVIGILENVFGSANMMVKRDLFIEKGGFSMDEDGYGVLAKFALKNVKFEAVSESLFWYRASKLDGKISIPKIQIDDDFDSQNDNKNSKVVEFRRDSEMENDVAPDDPLKAYFEAIDQNFESESLFSKLFTFQKKRDSQESASSASGSGTSTGSVASSASGSGTSTGSGASSASGSGTTTLAASSSLETGSIEIQSSNSIESKSKDETESIEYQSSYSVSKESTSIDSIETQSIEILSSLEVGTGYSEYFSLETLTASLETSESSEQISSASETSDTQSVAFETSVSELSEYFTLETQSLAATKTQSLESSEIISLETSQASESSELFSSETQASESSGFFSLETQLSISFETQASESSEFFSSETEALGSSEFFSLETQSSFAYESQASASSEFFSLETQSSIAYETQVSESQVSESSELFTFEPQSSAVFETSASESLEFSSLETQLSVAYESQASESSEIFSFETQASATIETLAAESSDFFSFDTHASFDFETQSIIVQATMYSSEFISFETRSFDESQSFGFESQTSEFHPFKTQSSGAFETNSPQSSPFRSETQSIESGYISYESQNTEYEIVTLNSEFEIVTSAELTTSTLSSSTMTYSTTFIPSSSMNYSSSTFSPSSSLNYSSTTTSQVYSSANSSSTYSSSSDSSFSSAPTSENTTTTAFTLTSFSSIDDTSSTDTTITLSSSSTTSLSSTSSSSSTSLSSTTSSSSSSASSTPSVVECPSDTYDCDGNCKGVDYDYGWLVDCTGECKPPGQQLSFDSCKVDPVCGGNNSTCTDCSGTVNGLKKIDVCGVCNSPGVIPTCFVFAAIDPDIFKNEIGTNITLIGAGFTDNTTLVNGVLVNSQYSSAFFIDTQTIIYTISTPFTSESTSSGVANFTISKPGDKSFTLSASFFNPSTSYLIQVSPVKTFVNTITRFNLSANNLYNFSTALCVFKTSTIVIAVNIVYVGPSAGYCQTSFSTNDDVLLYVLYSKPKLVTAAYPSLTNYLRPDQFVLTQSGLPLKFRVFQKAPIVLSAIFDNSGASISVNFDRPLSLIANVSLYLLNDTVTILAFNKSTTCSRAFSNNATADNQLWRLGMESDCFLSQSDPTTLTLTFLGAFTQNITSSPIIPNNFLTIGKNLIVAASALYSDASTGSVQVNPPLIISKPTVVLRASSLIGGCQDYSVDLSQTYGAAGRIWRKITASFTTNGYSLSLNQAASIDKSLNTQVAGVLNGSLSKIILMKSEIAAGNYTFNFTYTNFLGGSSFSTIDLEKVDLSDIPSIVITSEQGNIVQVSDTVQLSAKNIPSVGCGVYDKDVVFYVWSLVSNTGLPVPNLVSLNTTRASKWQLVIDPYWMYPLESYTFRVQARFSQSPNSYFFPISIKTSTDTIFANAGASQTVGTANDLIITATINDQSYNPSAITRTNPNQNIFSCTWSCINFKTKAKCLMRSLQPLTISTCFNANITGMLNPGVYVFSVTVVNTNTKSFVVGDSATITLKNGLVPIVSLQSSDLAPSAEQDDFYIVASIDPATVSSLSNVLYFLLIKVSMELV